MPRVKCPKCNKVETILKSGFIRQKQRYVCKECNYNFTLHHENRKAKHQARRNYHTTILDIAKAMGISATTVSRALHDHPDISRQTTAAIKEMAVEMDYHPNLLARSFVNRKTNTIGVIIPNLEATFFSSMLGGIQKVASQSGYRVIMCQSNEDHQTEVDNVHALMDSRVDGLLICHSMENLSYDHIQVYQDRGVPIVHFYRVLMDSNTSKVLANNVEGAENITQHLLDRGCRRIAIILGPKPLLITKERLSGYLKMLKKSDIAPDQKIICYTDYSQLKVIAAVDQLLELPEPPDAIFCISDRSAIYVLKHLKKRNIKVPDTIAVAGFGNDLMGELVEPGLTTYDVQTSRIGETAMEIMLDQMNGGVAYQSQLKTVSGELVIRESSQNPKY